MRARAARIASRLGRFNRTQRDVLRNRPRCLFRARGARDSIRCAAARSSTAIPNDLKSVISSRERAGRHGPVQDLSDLADDVIVADRALPLRDQEIARLGHRRLATIDVEPRPHDRCRVELARSGKAGADGVDVRALGDRSAEQHRLARGGRRADEIGAGRRGAGIGDHLDRKPEVLFMVPREPLGAVLSVRLQTRTRRRRRTVRIASRCALA